MDKVISLSNITKEFKILEHHEGLKGSFIDLFSKQYKTVKAVDNISLNINRGEIVGYLGPNGSGKSTTIKMMTGILKPTSGDIIVNGFTPFTNRVQIAQNIGMVFGQRTQLWWALPLIESFKVLKKIYNIDNIQFKEQLALYESIIDIKPLYGKPIREMSLGQRTLCDILAAFLHNPSIIFLDEPTIGLDVAIKAKIRELIIRLNSINKTTVLLTTHDIGDVEALCQRVIIIDKGKLLYDNSYDNLKNFFCSYKILKLKINDKSETDSVLYRINVEYHLKAQKDNDWISVLVDEDIAGTMDVLQFITRISHVEDIEVNGMNTESIIKKIYEGTGV